VFIATGPWPSNTTIRLFGSAPSGAEVESLEYRGLSLPDTGSVGVATSANRPGPNSYSPFANVPRYAVRAAATRAGQFGRTERVDVGWHESRGFAGEQDEQALVLALVLVLVQQGPHLHEHSLGFEFVEHVTEHDVRFVADERSDAVGSQGCLQRDEAPNEWPSGTTGTPLESTTATTSSASRSGSYSSVSPLSPRPRRSIA
jgi:hypothetical protein